MRSATRIARIRPRHGEYALRAHADWSNPAAPGRRKLLAMIPTTRFMLAALGLALGTAPLAAQDSRVVRGAVRSRDGGPVAGAVVFLPGAGRPAAISASSGAFALRVPRGPVRLVAAAIGFAPETLLALDPTAVVEFRLATAPLSLEPIAVTAEPAYTAATSRAVRALDVLLRPRESSQELLRLVPGLVIAQHAGGGKAEQIFLRGFDADHGTDVAISVDGTPVNLVSHAHGQGYADLHFLIPELVERVDARKGPYDPRDGDFATAGAVAVHTRDRLPEREVTSRVGSFRTAHTLALVPLGRPGAAAGGYVAAAGHLTRGPFDHPHYRRYNLFAKWTAPIAGGAELVAEASSFAARWDASGQIPERAVRTGLVGRFGALDPTEGGVTARHELALGLRGRPGTHEWDARAYAVRYRLKLFSNFTFFRNDTLNGDGIEQADARVLLGAQATYRLATRLGGRPALTGAGLVVRSDAVDVGLLHQARRKVLDTITTGHVVQRQLSAWVSEEVSASERIRLSFAARADAFHFALDGRSRWLALVSPKLNIAVQLSERTTACANAATGFHSNDARVVLAAPAAARVLPRALGTELGVRHSWAGGTVAAAAWALDLESELVFVGDAGTTEAGGRTRRVGLDLEARLRLAPWLWGDVDLNVAHARFRDAPAGADRVPLAPMITSTGGLTVRELGRVTGGLRYRMVGPRAANETGTVRTRARAIGELFARYRVAQVELVLAVDNLLDVAWNEAQFATTSRLRGEPAPVTELHFTPGAPRALQLGLEYRF